MRRSRVSHKILQIWQLERIQVSRLESKLILSCTTPSIGACTTSYMVSCTTPYMVSCTTSSMVSWVIIMMVVLTRSFMVPLLLGFDLALDFRLGEVMAIVGDNTLFLALWFFLCASFVIVIVGEVVQQILEVILAEFSFSLFKRNTNENKKSKQCLAIEENCHLCRRSWSSVRPRTPSEPKTWVFLASHWITAMSRNIHQANLVARFGTANL